MKNICGLFLLILSCSSPKPLNEFQWLTGTWTNQQDSAVIASEQWEQTSEFAIDGFGLTLEGNDTIFFESLKIRSESKGIYYIADLGNGPVPFKLTTSEDNTWTFENPSHDFPKKITYMNKGDSLVVHTSAENVTIPFAFKRSENGQ